MYTTGTVRHPFNEVRFLLVGCVEIAEVRVEKVPRRNEEDRRRKEFAPEKEPFDEPCEIAEAFEPHNTLRWMPRGMELGLELQNGLEHGANLRTRVREEEDSSTP